MLLAVAGLGICSAVAFGASYQLAQFFPPKATVALSVGYVAGAPLVLALEALLRVGPSAGWIPMAQLFVVVAALTFSGLGASVLVLRDVRSGLAGEGGERLLPLIDRSDHPEATVLEDGRGGGEDEQHWSLLLASEPLGSEKHGSLRAAAAAVVLAVGSSQLLFPLIPYARSAHGSHPAFGALLPQVGPSTPHRALTVLRDPNCLPELPECPPPSFNGHRLSISHCRGLVHALWVPSCKAGPDHTRPDQTPPAPPGCRSCSGRAACVTPWCA